MSNKVNYDILKEIEQCEDTRPDFMTQDDIGRSVLLHGHTSIQVMFAVTVVWSADCLAVAA